MIPLCIIIAVVFGVAAIRFWINGDRAVAALTVLLAVVSIGFIRGEHAIDVATDASEEAKSAAAEAKSAAAANEKSIEAINQERSDRADAIASIISLTCNQDKLLAQEVFDNKRAELEKLTPCQSLVTKFLNGEVVPPDAGGQKAGGSKGSK